MNTSFGVTTFFILLIISLTKAAVDVGTRPPVSNVGHRSKDANCLILGYHICLLNLFPANAVANGTVASVYNSTTTTPHTPTFAPNNNNNNTNDCFRLSNRTLTAANNRSLDCASNECSWNGTCVKNEFYTENYALHSIEDPPVTAYYENAHTITVSFPKFSNSTVLYILEARPVGLDTSDPFWFAGMSIQTTISYRVFDICHRHEFRLITLLTNGSVITFQPKKSNSKPPDFTIDNIRIVSLKYNPEEHQAVANFTWKQPYGYKNMDVSRYESYLHTLQCDVPSDLLNEAQSDTIVKTDDGGYMTITFPEAMVGRKCQFRLMVWATSICGNRTLTDAKIDVTLNCSTVEGYKCPVTELRPMCFSNVSIAPAQPVVKSESNVSVNISWTLMANARPQIYQVRWGPATAFDLRHKGQGEVSSSSSESKHRSEEGHSDPGPHAKAISNSKSAVKSRSHELNSNPDFSVWMLVPESIAQEKVPGDTSFIVLSNLSSDFTYGVQVCAIFNGGFKRPDWPKVATNEFECSCSDTGCFSSGDIQCHQKSASGRLAIKHSGTTQLPTIRPPLAVVLSVPQPPDITETIHDFTQTVTSTDPKGTHMRLTWKPPKNLLKQQMSGYDVTVESSLPCDQAPECCEYVEFTEIDQSLGNMTGAAELFLPTRVLQSHCEFVAKITTTAVTGISNVCLQVIRVPEMPPSLASPASPPKEENDHPSISCNHLRCSHLCNSTQCLCPNNFVLDSDGRTCSPGMDAMPMDSPGVDCIARFGCSLNFCDQNGCMCPSGYNMSLDGTSCITDKELRTAVLRVIPLQRNSDDSEEESHLNFFGISKAHNSSTNRKGDAPSPGNSIASGYIKREIAITVVLPVSCTIVLVSLFALLCYFYSAPMRICWTRHRGRFVLRRPSGIEGGRDISKRTGAAGVQIRVTDITPEVNNSGLPFKGQIPR